MPAGLPEVAVAGLGLVGGSLARALTAAGYRVIGVDRESVRRTARRAGAVAATAGTVERASSADVVVRIEADLGRFRLTSTTSTGDAVVEREIALTVGIHSVPVPASGIASLRRLD